MQASEKEKGAIARFFAEEGRRLSGYVRAKLRRIDEMEAEDIVADVMVNVLKKSGVTTDVQSLPAYVYRSLRNRITDFERSRRPTVSLDNVVGEDGGNPLVELLADDAADVATSVERSEFIARLGQALDRLEPKQRAVFIATELDGRSFKSLSAEWNEPVGTLLSRKSRAVKALREMLKEFKNG